MGVETAVETGVKVDDTGASAHVGVETSAHVDVAGANASAHVDVAGAKTNAEATAEATARLGANAQWQAIVDATTGSTYYYNTETGESSWARPVH